MDPRNSEKPPAEVLFSAFSRSFCHYRGLDPSCQEQLPNYRAENTILMLKDKLQGNLKLIEGNFHALPSV